MNVLRNKKALSLFMAIVVLFAFAAFSSNIRSERHLPFASVGPSFSNESSGNANVDKENQKVLIVYFSRLGNTDYPSDIDASTSASIVEDKSGRYGATEYVAKMIQAEVGGNIRLIETQKPYPVNFVDVIFQNHVEMNNDYLPPLKNNRLNMDEYDVVFIGYPVWAVSVPPAVRSFLSENDLSGKTVIPFCTHDGYGSGRSYSDIGALSPKANMKNGIAIEAKDVTSAKSAVSEWLKSIGVTSLKSNSADTGETPITITVGGLALNGVIYDTALAKEIKEMLPLTVSMVGYGGREYYGGIGQRPVNADGGQLNFANGDITYCAQNNTLAIFYAQTDRPNLGMKVIPIGKVTSDLTVFDTLGSRVNITFSLVK